MSPVSNLCDRRARRLIQNSYRQATIIRMKERKKKRQALTNRKTATAQARMKTISSLANDQPPPKRRKKGNEGASRIFACPAEPVLTVPFAALEDDFGADDEDWAVYREIVRHALAVSLEGTVALTLPCL